MSFKSKIKPNRMKERKQKWKDGKKDKIERGKRES